MTTANWKHLAQQLSKSLGLQYAPIAITFSQDAPEGVSPFEAEVPEPTDDGRNRISSR